MWVYNQETCSLSKNCLKMLSIVGEVLLHTSETLPQMAFLETLPARPCTYE